MGVTLHRKNTTSSSTIMGSAVHRSSSTIMGSAVHRKNAIVPFSPNMIVTDYEHTANSWLDIVQKILRRMSVFVGGLKGLNPNMVECTNPNIVDKASTTPLTPTSDEPIRKNAIFVPNSLQGLQVSGHVDYASFQIPVSVKCEDNSDDNYFDGCVPTNTYLLSSPVYGLNGNRMNPINNPI